MKSQALFIAFSLAACASDGTTAQPDAETPGVDAKIPTPDASNTCSAGDPTSCSGETICVAQKCEPAFNRIYRFHDPVTSAAVNNTGGTTWDSGGGEPDLYLVVKLNGTEIIHTSTKNDTFSATFTDTTDRQVLAGSKLELVLYDDDLDPSDLVYQCTFDPLNAQTLREGHVSCAGTGTSSGSAIALPISVK